METRTKLVAVEFVGNKCSKAYIVKNLTETEYKKLVNESNEFKLAKEEERQKHLKEIEIVFGKLAQHDYLLAKSIYDNFVDRGLIEDNDQFQKEWFDYIFKGEEIKHEPQEFKDILGKVVRL